MVIKNKSGTPITPLGQMLRLYRTSQGIDMREMGKQMGIGASTICRLESGKEVTLPTAIAILSWMCKRSDA